MVTTWGFFAANQWHLPSNGKTIDSWDPTQGDVWSRIADCALEDVDVAVNAAQQAYECGEYAAMNAAARGRLLLRFSAAIRANADRLSKAETKDNGKDRAGMLSALDGWLVDSFDYYAGLADKIEGAMIPVDVPNVLNYTRREPFGVVACVTAWNSPLLIAFWKISAAIAAGNTVVLKPSEHASVSTLVLMEVLAAAGMPPGVVNVVTGGPEVASSLVAHPQVRLVSFTGGVAGGRAIARLAGDHLKPTIMELGGKSPQLVLDDADIELAARGIVSGIFPPAGQSCIAGSRVLVHENRHDELVERVVRLTQAAKLGDPTVEGTHIGPIANKPHFDRVLQCIQAAKKEGAVCRYGGSSVQPDGCTGWFIQPTIFTQVRPEMAVAREEIFGPVLAIMSCQDDDHAVTLANDSDFGLAAGVWTADSARGLRLAHRIGAGTVYINNYFASAPQSPVGGYKASGYGRENGIEGALAFTQTKSVWLDLDPDQPVPFA